MDNSILTNQSFELKDIASLKNRLENEISKVIVGQKEVIARLLVALSCKGHCIFVGAPGLAKTLLISSLAKSMSLRFNRIQFTPDLMPSDITGTDILEEDPSTGKRRFRFLKGPIFANIILADEINRTPPKTQSALLQAMQEYQVTAGGATYELEKPFLVFATQNPIEQEGTYPLPEAQLDRFMFFIKVDYPSFEEEVRIVEATTGAGLPEPSPVMGPSEILALQEIVRKAPVSEHVLKYASSISRASRPKGPEALSFAKEYVEWGAGPRASQYMILAAKAAALFDGRPSPSCDDVRDAAKSVLRHRITLNYRAQAEGVTADDAIDALLKEVKES